MSIWIYMYMYLTVFHQYVFLYFPSMNALDQASAYTWDYESYELVLINRLYARTPDRSAATCPIVSCPQVPWNNYGRYHVDIALLRGHRETTHTHTHTRTLWKYRSLSPGRHMETEHPTSITNAFQPSLKTHLFAGLIFNTWYLLCCVFVLKAVAVYIIVIVLTKGTFFQILIFHCWTIFW